MTTAFDPWRDSVSDIDDILVVTASAGSGKTWMIAHLAARWLLEGGGEPHELLMVTFSRAAATELRARLSRRLRDIGAHLARLEDGPMDAPDDEEREWLERLVALHTLAALRTRLREVVTALDTVHARTIHSFAALATQRDDSALTDAAHVRRAAAHESVTHAVSAGDVSVTNVIDHLEDGSGLTPGGVRLATLIVASLASSASAGGLSRGTVTLAGATDDADGRAVAVVLEDADTRTRTLLADSDAVTFDDLIGDLVDEVTEPDSPLADRLRSQFGLVLIDEFQDTNVQQWRIFDTVFRHGATRVPVVLVGDPKQAIYEFRGGDVSVLERVRGELIDSGRGRELSLAVNYRSTSGLLSALNTFFGATDEWNFGDATTIPYEPVVASSDHEGQSGRFVLRRCPTAHEAQLDVVATVRDLLASGVAARDIAVLGRSHSSGTEIRVSLERAGIATATIGGGSVFVTTAAVQLRTLLWVMRAPTDPRRHRLLAATWFATLTPDDVARATRELRHDGVAAASRTLLGALHANPDHLSERDLTDVEHLLDLLTGRHPGPVDPDSLITELDTSRVSGEDEDPDASARRRVESDRDAVRVMTIHAAKGLQFPVVLIPQIESHSTRARLESWTTTTGRTIDLGAFVGHRADESPVTARSAAEDRRLMYVALTRAEQLCVAWVPGDKGQWPHLVAPVLAGDTSDPSLVVQDAGDTLEDLSDLALASTAPRASAPPRYVGPAPLFDESGRRWSYSALALGALAHPDDAGDAVDAVATAVAVADDGADHDLFDGRRGATLGVAVHGALERLVGVVGSDDVGRIRLEVAAAWRRAGFPAPSDGVSSDIATLMARPLGALTDNATLDSFRAPGTTVAEMRFTLPLSGHVPGRLSALARAVADLDPDGPFRDYFAGLATHAGDPDQLLRGYLTGSLDVVLAVGAPSRYVIIDYKTNYLPAAVGYEPPALVDDMVRAGYPVQALLYAVALHRFLRGRIADYDPDVHLGAVGYLYVRGAMRPLTPVTGLATWRPPSAAVARVSDILDGRVA